MRTFDFSPLYRSTVGFEPLFEMLDQATRSDAMTNWPPYDIERVTEDHYRITLAVAGFSPDEIELTQLENTLLIVGQKKGLDEEKRYLHRGIAARTFKQTFSIADHVKVTGASFENGLLTVDLVREIPEELKPRRIAIASGGQKLAQDNEKQIEHEPAKYKTA
jgi:molecular chaperone IbpA